MKKLAILAGAAWLIGGASVIRAEEKTIRGTISDSLCGLSHKAMAEKQGSKITDRDCVIACLSYSTENSPKLVVAAADGKIYQISNQRFPGLIRQAGDPLLVTGDVNGTTITISKVEAAPKAAQ